MNTKFLKKFLIILAFFPLLATAQQSQYYYRTGDTIVGRSPIYFYQWWTENWLADTSNRLVLQKTMYLYDEDGEFITEWATHAIPHGELLQYCYTDQPLKIIGIATAAIVCGITQSIEIMLLEPECQEYLRLYEASRDTFTMLKEMPYNMHTPRRFMKIDYRNPYPETGYYEDTTICCYYPTPDDVRYNSIREYYFDKPVTVYDSFYVGITTECHPYDFPPNAENPVNPVVVVNDLSLSWDSLKDGSRTIFSNGCTHFCNNMPNILHKYRHIWYNHGTTDTVDRNWHWWNSPYFMLEFPIVVIDSSYIIPPYECPPVENARQSDILGNCAVLLWNTHPDQNSWQVSYGPEGTMPDDGTVINCPIQATQICGLDSGVHYTAYVRAVCDHDSICYSQWSDPVDICICDTSTNTEGIVSAMDALTYIVPNPANDMVQVISSFSMNRVEVFDLNGKTMIDLTANGISTSFRVKNWPSGMYIIIIHTPAGNISKKLIVKGN